MDRYPTLVKEIFESFLKVELVFTKEQQIDNNKIHGLLEVMNFLIDKHDLFKFISVDELVIKIEPLLELNL